LSFLSCLKLTKRQSEELQWTHLVTLQKQ